LLDTPYCRAESGNVTQIVVRPEKLAAGFGGLFRFSQWGSSVSVVSIAAWRLTVASETHTATLEFAQRADNQARVLQSGIADYLDKLYAVRALFDSSNDAISRDEFERFSNSLLVNHAAILDLSWIPRVKNDERAAHELAAVRDGLPITAFVPLAQMEACPFPRRR